MLRERFATAGAHTPLNDLSDADRAELTALLQRADALEDLPGRWQAALLAAEDGEQHGGCGHAS